MMYGLIVVPRNGDSAVYLYRRAEDFAESLLGWMNRIQLGSWSGELGAFEGSSVPIDTDIQVSSSYALGGFNQSLSSTLPSQKLREAAINVIDDSREEQASEIDELMGLWLASRDKV
jgi:hypothetical protein